MSPPPLPSDHDTPRGILQRWLPHALLMCLVGLSLLLLMVLLAPLRDPIFLAISLAVLTSPLLFEPMNGLLGRIMPTMSPGVRRQLAGVMATIALVIILLTPLIALILNTVGSIPRAADVVIGIATRDAERMDVLFKAVERQANALLDLYPGLPFDASQVRGWFESLLSEASAFGPTLMSFLFRGTGSLLAHFALALIILPNCFAQGAVAARFLLGYTPLDDTQTAAFAQRYRSVVKRLLSDTIAFAFCRGLVLGILAAIMVGLPLVPLVLVATFLSLVPAVGTTMIWLPLVLVQWSTGNQLSALVLAALSITAAWLLSHFRRRVGLRLDEASGSWLSFLLFLGLAGGLLSFGVKGFIIGPVVMVLAILVFGHLLPYYGVGKDADEDSGLGK